MDTAVPPAMLKVHESGQVRIDQDQEELGMPPT
jgi:hypothetical protein